MGAQIEPIDCAEVRWRWDGFLPRSYLFSLAEVESKPTGLQSVPLPRGRLFISPDYECHVDCAGSSYVVLIGHCLDLAHPDCGEPEIARSLLRCAVEHGIDAMLSRTDDLFGRFGLICHVGDRCHVVGDACGTRTIYFAEDRPAVASHSTLLGELIGVAPRRDMFRHYWCALPGNASPVEGVRILPANFVLALGDRTMRRFWPRTSRCERATSEVIDEAEALLTRVAQATAARWRPALSLTAGLDSRLSLSIYSGLPDLVTFTYDRGVQDTVDADTASRLSKRLGIAHRRLPLVEPHNAPAAYQVQRLISDCPINTNLGPICLNGFRDGNNAFIHVRSSLAEIGRSFWRNHPGMPTTFDPSNWTLVSLSKATAALPPRASGP